MNEKFHALPKEKQLAILNAAMEVFASYDYKKASTDLIAIKAGISKGLLFYYFHNKKELFFEVYRYTANLIKESVVDSKLLDITDYFDLIDCAAINKMKLLKQHPYIMDFSIRCFYSEQEEVSPEIKNHVVENIKENFRTYFTRVDFSKFREDADPCQIYQMLIYMTDGYLHHKRMQGKPILPEDIETEYRQWVGMLKKLTYKEEFL